MAPPKLTKESSLELMLALTILPLGGYIGAHALFAATRALDWLAGLSGAGNSNLGWTWLLLPVVVPIEAGLTTAAGLWLLRSFRRDPVQKMRYRRWSALSVAGFLLVPLLAPVVALCFLSVATVVNRTTNTASNTAPQVVSPVQAAVTTVLNPAEAVASAKRNLALVGIDRAVSTLNGQVYLTNVQAYACGVSHVILLFDDARREIEMQRCNPLDPSIVTDDATLMVPVAPNTRAISVGLRFRDGTQWDPKLLPSK